MTRAWQIGNLTCLVDGNEEEDQDVSGTQDRFVVVVDIISTTLWKHELFLMKEE